jgi:hypothetical protein
MKTFLAVIILAVATPAIARAQVSIPPANGPQAAPAGPQATIGCGPSNVNWDVTTDEKNHPTAAPEPTKAHLYLIQDDTEYVPHPRPSVRFGIDGQWVGATHSNSYFFVAVDPGEHLVCINWQGMVGAGGQHRESVLHLTAEAGTDYYFTAHDVYHGGGPGPYTGPPPFVVFTQINSDQAMMMMSRYAYATSTPKK